MKFFFPVLLALAQAMLTAADHNIKGPVNVKPEVILRANNEWISGWSTQQRPRAIRQLKLLKNITEDDGLTVSYAMTWYGPPSMEDVGIPFCMENTSSDTAGTMVKILRMTLNMATEGCPITEVKSDTSASSFTVYGYYLPGEPPTDCTKQAIDLYSPDREILLTVYAKYCNGYGY